MLTDRGTKEDRLRDSLARARESLARYAGTPCEPDYRAMVDRYERRLADEDDGRRYVGVDHVDGQPVTLDGQPATITGRREPFATVAQYPRGLAVEYAWPTVARIMRERGGAFRS